MLKGVRSTSFRVTKDQDGILTKEEINSIPMPEDDGTKGKSQDDLQIVSLSDGSLPFDTG